VGARRWGARVKWPVHTEFTTRAPRRKGSCRRRPAAAKAYDPRGAGPGVVGLTQVPAYHGCGRSPPTPSDVYVHVYVHVYIIYMARLTDHGWYYNNHQPTSSPPAISTATPRSNRTKQYTTWYTTYHSTTVYVRLLCDTKPNFYFIFLSPTP
jgi:hypothetical protein